MPKTLSMHNVLPRRAKTDNYFFQDLPYVDQVTDDVFSSRDGELTGCILIHGISSETADGDDLDATAATFARLVSQTRGAVSFYVSKITSYRDFDYEAEAGEGFAASVDQLWKEGFEGERPLKRYNVVSIGIRPSTQDTFFGLFGGRNKTAEEREKLLITLNKILDEVVRAFGHLGAERLTFSGLKLRGFLAAFHQAHYVPPLLLPRGRTQTALPQVGLPIAACIAADDTVFRGKYFIRRDASPIERKDVYGAILSLKDYPSSTEPGLYDGLELNIPTVVTHSFIPVAPNVAQEKTNIIAKQMRASQDRAVSLEADLHEALDKLASGRMTLGNHHCTVAIHAESMDELEDAISHVQRAGAIGGGRFHHERFAARAAFFAQHPGNQSYRPRVATISADNFADMVAFHNRPTGKTEKLPWGDPVAHLRTAQNDIYSFNFHSGQQTEGEDTPGHTIVFGGTGTGKTTFANFLTAKLLPRDVRVFALDKDRGMEVPMRAMGIPYSQVQVGKPTGLNPFASEVDERGVAWMATWLERLVSYDHPITSTQRNALAAAAKENADAAIDDPDLNTFDQFVSFFRALEDDGDLSDRFSEWTEGRFKWMFDGQGQDPLANAKSSMAFDVTELFDEPIMRTAWLGYVLRRIERIVEDGRPTLIIMDEAWKLLDDEKFVERIKEWMLVMRKKNTVVMMLTQTPEHLLSSAASDAIMQGVTTKIAFQSTRNNPEGYMRVGFTETEALALRSQSPTRRALCVSDTDSLMLDLNLSTLGGALNILGPSDAIKQNLPHGWRDNPDFWKDII